MTDSISRDILIEAPPARVWEVLTRDWGTWFRTTLDGPFRPGATVSGAMTMPGVEGMPFKARVEAMEPPHSFVYSWPNWDSETRQVREDWPWTRVAFELRAEGAGTRVTVTESGFDATGPVGARLARENAGGWEHQLRNLSEQVHG